MTAATPPPVRMAYGLDEVLELVPIGRTKLFGLIAEGKLPTITIGRRRFVTAAALEAFATNGTP